MPLSTNSLNKLGSLQGLVSAEPKKPLSEGTSAPPPGNSTSAERNRSNPTSSEMGLRALYQQAAHEKDLRTQQYGKAARNEIGKMLRDEHFDAAGFKKLISSLDVDELEKHDGNGFTPLSTAVLNRNKEATDLLLEQGVSPDVKDFNHGSAAAMLSDDPVEVVHGFTHYDSQLTPKKKLAEIEKHAIGLADKRGMEECATSTGESVERQVGSYMMAMSHLSKTLHAPINDWVGQPHKTLGNMVTSDQQLNLLQFQTLTAKPEVTKTYLALGADPNVKDPQLGRTALHWAFATDVFALSDASQAYHNNHVLEVATALVESGADLATHDASGSDVLAQAARTADGQTIKMLTDHGADVNAKNIRGSTAMHSAAMSGNTSAFQALIEAGGDVNAKNTNGISVLKVAQMKNNDPYSTQGIIDAIEKKNSQH